MSEFFGRLRFSIDAPDARAAHARLDELIRAATDIGLIVEETGIENPDAEDITPREQPPTERS